jgi:hypothetical protein
MNRLPVILAILACGCVEAPPRRNLQPLIAVAGTCGAMRHPAPEPDPAPPAPAPAGCAAGCKCNGTGIEKSGDGLSDVNCRCPDNCQCKAKKVATKGPVCTTGTCGWPPRNIAR